MEEKLKSILRPIPWSLILKAFLFALGWLLLPFWLFIIFSLYLYLVPLFQAKVLALPFVFTLFLASLTQPHFWVAVFFGVIFFFILGIKDLVFVDRRTSYGILAFVLMFVAIFYSFSRFDYGWDAAPFLWMLGLSAVFSLLLNNFLKNYIGQESDRRLKNTLLGLVFLLFFESGLVILLLPITFLVQSALLFLIAVALFELSSDYFLKRLDARRVLIYFSVFFGISALIISGSFAA